MAVDERTGEFKNSKEAKDLARRLDFHNWLIAFDAYALLAVCCEQLTFSQAMAYKAMIVEVRSFECFMPFGWMFLLCRWQHWLQLAISRGSR